MRKLKITETERKQDLEYLANKFFNMSCEIRDKETEGARRFMAISWGLNRYLERVEMMTLCTRYLYMLGVRKSDIAIYHNYGFDVAVDSIKKLDEKIEVS